MSFCEKFLFLVKYAERRAIQNNKPFLIYCFIRNRMIKFYFIISVEQTELSYSLSISFTILYPSSFTNTASLLFIGIKSILSL